MTNLFLSSKLMEMDISVDPMLPSESSKPHTITKMAPSGHDDFIRFSKFSIKKIQVSTSNDSSQ